MREPTFAVCGAAVMAFIVAMLAYVQIVEAITP